MRCCASGPDHVRARLHARVVHRWSGIVYESPTARRDGAGWEFRAIPRLRSSIPGVRANARPGDELALGRANARPEGAAARTGNGSCAAKLRPLRRPRRLVDGLGKALGLGAVLDGELEGA